MFDEMLVRVLIASGLCLAGINLAAVSSFVVSLTAVVLLAFVEPLYLRLWGTTPGRPCWGCGWLEWMEKTSHTARA